MGNNKQTIISIQKSNESLSSALNFFDLKNNNLEGLLKKVCHDALKKYIKNFYGDNELEEEKYFSYLDDICIFLQEIIAKEKLGVEDLLSLHSKIATPLVQEHIKYIGTLRVRPVVTREKKHHTGLQENFISQYKVKKYTEEAFQKYNEGPDSDFEKIVVLYNTLIAKIHPFHNANGRTLAILFDTLLIKHNFFPVFFAGYNKHQRVEISEKYIKDRNMEKLISSTYTKILDIYQNYQIS